MNRRNFLGTLGIGTIAAALPIAAIASASSQGTVIRGAKGGVISDMEFNGVGLSLEDCEGVTVMGCTFSGLNTAVVVR